jgi:integrase/recombinase XerD
METIDFCSKEDINILLAHAKNIKHRVQILLLHDAGLRVSEMCGLKWNALDFRNKTLTVRSLKKRGDEKKRVIPVSERLLAAIVDLLQKYPADDKNAYIFPSPNDKTKPIGRSAVNNTFYKIKEAAPELGRIYPHKLRHTFATNLRANNAELADIKDLLGHTNLNTSLIYAHADSAKLREMINATLPKPTLAERLKQALFKPAKKRINLSCFDNSQFIGRELEARNITELIEKNISVLVTGKIGTGKSTLINNLSFTRPVLEMEDCKDFKKSLANILLFLFDGDKEQVIKLFYPDTDKANLTAKVNRESVPAICKILLSACRKQEYILKIGTVDNITPTVVSALEILKDHFTIITTARNIKTSQAGFIWNFERVELENLPRPAALRLTQYLVTDLEPENPEYLRNKVWDISEGNPRQIQELCDRFRKEPVLDNETVSDICGGYIGKQTTEIDMSIYLLLIFGGLAVLRYLAAETANPSLRFIGGCFMILLMFGRYFFNSARRKTI